MALNTISPAAIREAITAPDSRVQGELTPLYEVASYRITYRTTDKDGQPVRASGLVSVPLKPTGARSPVLSYQHATTFRNDHAPSIKVEAMEPPIVLASLGYIVVAADYVGFGESQDKEHPYLTSEPTARAVIDMLAAAQTWRQRHGVADNGQLFLAGYSEGGYATLAAQRAIEQEGGALRQQLQASVPGAGPYDVLATLDTQLARLREVSSALAALFSPRYLRHAGGAVRREIRRFLVRQMVSGDADVSYQTLFIDRYMADDRDAIEREHSVHLGWAPAAPVHLFHGRGDQTVPFAASESALATLQAQGAQQVSLTECSDPNAGHTQCVPEYFRFALERMGQLARDL